MDFEEYAAILHDKDEEYYIIKEIGEGVSSFVYLALNIKDQNTYEYAIKLYLNEKSYEIETKNLKLIEQNKNIVKLINYGDGILERGGSLESLDVTSHFFSDEVKFSIFEYLPNGELYNYIFYPNKGFKEEISRKLFIDLLNSIESCHKNGISHGDIKLENILLDKDFNIKLIDFGFSKNINDGLIYESNGTYSYVSPEVLIAATKGYDGIKNDIFSLGIILFSLIFGFLPFKNATFTDFRYKFIIKEQYENFWKSVNNNNDTISNNFKDLFERMICFDPKERLTINEIKNHPWVNYHWDECNICDLFNDECSLSNNNNNVSFLEIEILKEFNQRKNIIDSNMKKE